MESIPVPGGTVRCRIVCRGTPAACGEQYGEAAREWIRREAENFALPGGADGTERRFAARARRSLETFAPEVLEELLGIARGSGVPAETLLAMNVWESVGKDEMPDRCTTFLLGHSDRGTVVAKNNDGAEHERERCPFLLREVRPDRGIPFLQVTYAGWLSGLDMMNAEGLANTHGSVGSVFLRDGMRLDIRLQCYRLMRECRTVEEFRRRLPEVPLTGKGFTVAVADPSGDNAIIEAAVPKVVTRARRVGFDFAANLYHAPELDGCDARTPEGRLLNRRRREFLEKLSPPRTVEELKAIMAAHGAAAPCRHGGENVSTTFWSMIALPEERRLLLAPEAPCRCGYVEIEIR